MLEQRVTIGLAPCRRWRDAKRTVYCNPEVAQAIKKETVAHIRKLYETQDVHFVDIDFLNEEGLMSDIAEAPAIANHFRREGVDAVFIINCNFGSEEVAGMVGKLVGKPVLLWGPRDKIEPNGHRDTDSQCGTFAITKQLQRFHVPFSYIVNSRVDSPEFDRGLRKFIAVARMVKNFKGMRVAQIGNRPRAFYSVICNEAELLERFGIEVIPITTVQAERELQAILNSGDAESLDYLKSKYDVGGLGDDVLRRSAAFLRFYRDILKRHDCRVIASECATIMEAAFGAMPCPAISLLAEEGVIISCETDVLGAISMGLLAAAAGRGATPMFGEFTMRHPEDDNAELLWHCGALPHCLHREGCTPKILPNTRNEHAMRVDPEYTLCRLDAIDGQYHLLAGSCRGFAGPDTYGVGFWVKFDDLPGWERALAEGPFIHHTAEIPGNYVEELVEFGRYFPGIRLALP